MLREHRPKQGIIQLPKWKYSPIRNPGNNRYIGDAHWEKEEATKELLEEEAPKFAQDHKPKKGIGSILRAEPVVSLNRCWWKPSSFRDTAHVERSRKRKAKALAKLQAY